MSVQLFVGAAPQNIKQWFIEDYFDRCTQKWVSSDTYISYMIIGVLGQSIVQQYSQLKSGKIRIGSAVTSIGYRAFNGCSGLTSVTIADGVTSIGFQAFYNCSLLKSVTIGNGVTSIGEWAFMGCNNLTSVTIPASVTSIEQCAFCNCSNLKSVHITDLAAWCKISFYDYNSNPLYNAHDLYLNGEKITDLVIPDGVTSIGSHVFCRCSDLTSVTIPDSVTSIGDMAFYYCSGLTSVTIPDSVTSIGASVFSGCSGLTSVTIGNSVTSIGAWAFANCSGLTSVTIPDSVTSIGDMAFENCEGLTSVTIPDSVTSIGDMAFSHCSGLTSVYFDGITVPEGNNGCFYGASNLNDVYMLNITEADVQAQLDSNISKWWLGVDDSGYHTVTIHCKDGDVVIDPTPSGSGSGS